MISGFDKEYYHAAGLVLWDTGCDLTIIVQEFLGLELRVLD
jgi:hypothetical protein